MALRDFFFFFAPFDSYLLTFSLWFCSTTHLLTLDKLVTDFFFLSTLCPLSDKLLIFFPHSESAKIKCLFRTYYTAIMFNQTSSLTINLCQGVLLLFTTRSLILEHSHKYGAPNVFPLIFLAFNMLCVKLSKPSFLILCHQKISCPFRTYYTAIMANDISSVTIEPCEGDLLFLLRIA